MIQIKDQRKDGAYGTVVPVRTSKDRRFLEDGISLSAGWFPLGCTDVPSVDQLGELQKLLGGAGDSALDPPKYWGQVKDPLMAEYSAAARKRGYQRVQRHQPDDGAAAAQDPLHRAGPERRPVAVVLREEERHGRARKGPRGGGCKYVRNWSRAVWKSTRRWLPGIFTPSRLRRKYRVDGVGPPEI